MMTDNGDTHDSRKDIVVKATPAKAEDKVLPVTVSLRSYFSRHHLFGARHFVELTLNIEDAHTEGRLFNFDNHRVYAINAILSSVAYMEAAINQVFQDAADGEEFYLRSLSRDSKATMKKLWTNKRRLGLLEKYRLALKGARQSLLDRGSPLYERAYLVVQLRNALVHAMPTSYTVGTKDQYGWVKSLKAKRFARHPLMRNSGNPFFPDKCLAYGCAKWALNSCEKFVGTFYKKMSLNPP